MRRERSMAQVPGLQMMGLFLSASLAAMVGSGCAAAGVGDPCVPEAIPGNGFTESEVYVETSAVQCRTRVCVVFHLQGNPDNLQSESCPLNVAGEESTCVDDTVPFVPGEELLENNINRVFCSCRCRAGEGNPNLPLCACGGGYHCADDGYCVLHEADSVYCDASYEVNCPGRCDLTTNRCR